MKQNTVQFYEMSPLKTSLGLVSSFACKKLRSHKSALKEVLKKKQQTKNTNKLVLLKNQQLSLVL